MGGRVRWVSKAEVKRKAKGAADGGDATDNVSPINGAAVPSIGCGVGCFDEDSVSPTIVSSDGDGFV